MLCYSTGSLPLATDASSLIQLLEKTPFRCIEWALNSRQLDNYSSGGLQNQLLKPACISWFRNQAKILHKEGYKVVNIHCGFPKLFGLQPHEPSLSALNGNERQHKINLINGLLPLTDILECNHVTFISGLQSPLVPLNVQEEYLEESLTLLASLKPNHITYCLEQEPEHTLHSCGQLLRYCKKFSLKAVFDLGHAWVLGEELEMSLQSLCPYIYNIHIEDIANRIHKHLLMGQGDIPFYDFARIIKQFNYQGFFTPDLYPFAENPTDSLHNSNGLPE